ncbi:MAG: hypothetical protein WA160_09065 [Pseudobdellovibrio sp.]
MLKVFIVSSFFGLSAFAQTAQQKIDHSTLAWYDENSKSNEKVVSVDKGYLIASSGLAEYVPVKGSNWDSDVDDKVVKNKSVLSQLKNIFNSFVSLKSVDQKEANSVKIELQKVSLNSSMNVGKSLKGILEVYKTSSPLKIINTNICQASGPKLEVIYNRQAFLLNQSLDSSAAKTHVTQIQYKSLIGHETEQFIQTGSFQLPVYESYKYQLTEKEKNISKIRINSNEKMLEQFVSKLTSPLINKAELNTELLKAWLLLKRVGGCCAEANCRDALVGRKQTLQEYQAAPILRNR